MFFEYMKACKINIIFLGQIAVTYGNLSLSEKKF